MLRPPAVKTEPWPTTEAQKHKHPVFPMYGSRGVPAISEMIDRGVKMTFEMSSRVYIQMRIMRTTHIHKSTN